MEYLRDPIWQVVGIILAVLVPSSIYLAQRQRKALSYQVLADLALMGGKEAAVNDLEVLYKKQLMKRPGLVLIRLVNSGNTPIVSADYETPVSLTFEKGTRVLAADVLTVEPVGLGIQAEVSLDERSIRFSSVLLNPRDCFECRALVDGSGSLTVSGRIAGISSIGKVKDINWWGSGVAAVCLVGAVITLALSPSPMSRGSLRPDEMKYAVIISVLMGVSAIGMLVSSLKSLRRMKKDIQLSVRERRSQREPS